jgi:hypothetical protein
MSNRFIPPRSDDPSANGPFEFGPAEDDVFSRLAGSMKFVAIVLAGLGVLMLVGALIAHQHMAGADLISSLVQGLVSIIIGGWLLGAASSLRAITETRGNDVPNLMVAMDKLRKVYTLQAVLLAIAGAVVVVAVVLAIAR